MVLPTGPLSPFVLIGLLALAGLLPGAAAAQTIFDRNQAYDRCYRDAARRFGPPPRVDPKPGEDLVVLARRRQDYDDRYSRFLNTCLYEAEQRLRGQPPR